MVSALLDPPPKSYYKTTSKGKQAKKSIINQVFK